MRHAHARPAKKRESRLTLEVLELRLAPGDLILGLLASQMPGFARPADTPPLDKLRAQPEMLASASLADNGPVSLKSAHQLQGCAACGRGAVDSVFADLLAGPFGPVTDSEPALASEANSSGLAITGLAGDELATPATTTVLFQREDYPGGSSADAGHAAPADDATLPEDQAALEAMAELPIVAHSTSAPGITYRDNDDVSPSFTRTSGWTRDNTQGYRGSVHYAAARQAGQPLERATWSVSGLNPGFYHVAATWTHHANRATNAPYTILDTGTVRGTVFFNQELAPKDFTADGVDWETLITQAEITTDGILKVELSNDANEYVIADGIRVQDLYLRVVDDNTGFPTTAYSSSDGFAGSTTQGYKGRVEFALGTTGVFSEFADFRFIGLSPGIYTVAATWTPHENRADNAPFRIFNDETFLQEVRVNQQFEPGAFGGDFVFNGANWEELGSFNITQTVVRVRLQNNIGNNQKYVIADAVLIWRTGDLPPG